MKTPPPRGRAEIDTALVLGARALGPPELDWDDPLWLLPEGAHLKLGEILISKALGQNYAKKAAREAH